jgi:hypothetical protein
MYTVPIHTDADSPPTIPNFAPVRDTHPTAGAVIAVPTATFRTSESESEPESIRLYLTG